MNEKLVNILASIFEVKAEDINKNLKKEDVDSWDSLKQMDLIVSLEEEFKISLEIEDIVKMNSVQSIVDVLKNKGAI